RPMTSRRRASILRTSREAVESSGLSHRRPAAPCDRSHTPALGWPPSYFREDRQVSGDGSPGRLRLWPMKLGVAIFPTDYTIRPDDFARACEERGFESVWFPEHTHIPASRKTPYPAGGDLPQEYWHTHDPVLALMGAAAVTKRIKLATGICLLIERDPITTAKEVASLDQLSNGRVLFGIGAGWNVEEMGNHGTDFRHRWTVLQERVEAMKRIWTEEAAEYHGKFVDFDPIW